ncbi:hypothetical protein F4808DRAFT_128737 [Astrocystis sublimbata]|nr:hypothetical protein F4808DRAFT_128737 [Astrocystis sublimbata]
MRVPRRYLLLPTTGVPSRAVPTAPYGGCKYVPRHRRWLPVPSTRRGSKNKGTALKYLSTYQCAYQCTPAVAADNSSLTKNIRPTLFLAMPNVPTTTTTPPNRDTTLTATPIN